MAYEKPFFVTQDFALGIQSVNRAIENNAAARTLWTARHGYDESNRPALTAQEQVKAFGAHNDILISRSVSAFTVGVADDGSSYLQPRVEGRLVRQTQRLGVGQWRVFLSPTDIFGAVARCYASAALDYEAVCRIVSGTGAGTSLALGGYVDVDTWDISGGARVDTGFSLAVWARVD